MTDELDLVRRLRPDAEVDRAMLDRQRSDLMSTIRERTSDAPSPAPHAPRIVPQLAYDDLDTQPVELLRRIYARLELDGLEQAVPRFGAYLDSIGTFSKNVFEHDTEATRLVEEYMGPYLAR